MTNPDIRNRNLEQLAHSTFEFANSDQISPGLSESGLRDLIYRLLLIKAAEEILPPAFTPPLGSVPSAPSPLSNLNSVFTSFNQLFNTELFSTSWKSDGISSDQITRLIRFIEGNSVEYTPESLAYLYENFALTANPKLDGIFYTPSAVVKYMVHSTLSKVSNDPFTNRILDPACGSGVFLIESYRFLLNYYGSKSSNFKSRSSILADCIFGVDIDSTAVEVTRYLLYLVLLEDSNSSPPDEDLLQLPALNLRCGNSLLAPEDLPENSGDLSEINPFCWQSDFAAAGDSDCKFGFTHIIGNPPYGLSRDDQISAKENSLLKRAFARFKIGKPNKYLLFLLRAYELLSNSGRLCFIVPNAWLGIRSGRPVREILLKTGSLKSVSTFDGPVFDQPSVEPVVVEVDQGLQDPHLSIRTLSAGVCKVLKESVLTHSSCLQNPDLMIPLNWTDQVGQLLSQFRSECLSLSSADSPVIPRIALQAYATGKGVPPQTRETVKQHLFHSSHKLDNASLPYLNGSDLYRYALEWSGSYLRHGEWLAEPQQRDYFQGPRILLREVISPPPYVLTACYTDQEYLYNKSVLHLLPKESTSREEIIALCAIMNSKLASFIICFSGRKSQRSIFPKVVNDDLKDFPIPKRYKRGVNRLVKLTEKMTRELQNSEEGIERFDRKFWNRIRESGSDSQTKTIALIQDQIDHAVYDLYGLTDHHRSELERSLEEVVEE